MNTARGKGSARSKRSVLPVLWGTAFAALVAWAGCGPSVTSSGGTGAGGSSGDTSVSTTITAGPVTTSGTGSTCDAAPECTGFPSPGSPCTTPGDCCPYFMCDHAGGNYEQDVVCSDAGTWEW